MPERAACAMLGATDGQEVNVGRLHVPHGSASLPEEFMAVQPAGSHHSTAGSDAIAEQSGIADSAPFTEPHPMLQHETSYPPASPSQGKDISTSAPDPLQTIQPAAKASAEQADAAIGSNATDEADSIGKAADTERSENHFLNEDDGSGALAMPDTELIPPRQPRLMQEAAGSNLQGHGASEAPGHSAEQEHSADASTMPQAAQADADSPTAGSLVGSYDDGGDFAEPEPESVPHMPAATMSAAADPPLEIEPAADTAVVPTQQSAQSDSDDGFGEFEDAVEAEDAASVPVPEAAAQPAAQPELQPQPSPAASQTDMLDLSDEEFLAAAKALFAPWRVSGSAAPPGRRRVTLHELNAQLQRSLLRAGRGLHASWKPRTVCCAQLALPMVACGWQSVTSLQSFMQTGICRARLEPRALALPATGSTIKRAWPQQ